MNINNEKKIYETKPSCVVGIGASAGGLEALQQFLTFLPKDTNMAFVIVQHLSPDHKSLLVDILGKYTSMPVFEAQDGMHIEKNSVYLLPPKYNMEIISDTLYLSEYNHAQINHPIDIFFRSLGIAYENKAVAVIFSGTGSDGTNGIRTIKENNGMILVQSPESSKFDGMPRNAIATGFVDLILNPSDIAKEMSHISQAMINTHSKMEITDNDLMSQVFAILKNITNVNYTYYKQTTILRRIERRIVVTHNRNLRDYVNYLKHNEEEAQILAKEVLIGVTNFFRDADYFEVLKNRVIETIVKESTPSDMIRIWVAGCSTGEEAYSIAILFAEVFEELQMKREIKIFATDLDMDSINFASRGVYGDNIIEDVSVSRLARFFTRKGSKYVVNHEIRRMIVFAQHNVFQDPPFGKLDLISCRNMLIYFQTILQKNLFSIFHTALKNKGYLFLGRSESVSNFDEVFKVHCANEKIFIHNASGKAPTHDRISYSLSSVENYLDQNPNIHMHEDFSSQYSSNELDTKVFEKLMPATVLIDEKNNLQHSYGDCSQFITIPVGQITLDIFSLIRTDLKIAVSKVLKEAKVTNKTVGYDHIPVQIDDEPEYITVMASPIDDKLGDKTGIIAITFIREKRILDKNIDDFKIDTASAERISDLEKELHVTQENLKNTVTELESVNAELQAANEELLTANEELQSSNEELQSVNEELYTVNSEYQAKVSELANVNDDMANFLATTLVGIIMVNNDLNIRKFTEYITTEFNVAEQDVGRTLRFIAYNFATIDLITLSRLVQETLEPVELHCASVTGKTYLVRIAPYRKVSNGMRKGDLDGLVLTFVDTTKQVNDQQQIDEMAKALRVAMRTSQEKEAFLSHMSHDMRTPMTAITGLTQLSMIEEDCPPKIKENLQKIETSGKYLLNLIDEVLETSKINAGKVVSISKALPENQVFDDVNSIILQRCKKEGVKYKSKFNNCKGLYAMIDSEHLMRILVNLLTNAIKFTPKGGCVEFSGESSYKDNKIYHTYEIKDNGKGIGKTFQKRMFLPFEQEEEVKGIYDGTGLGLFVVKNLVELLDGKIECYSIKGQGTTFTVEVVFDKATDEQIEIASSKPIVVDSNKLNGNKVLVVEDNKINAEVIVNLLKAKGITSEVAYNGQEAIDLYKKRGSFYYQAILMDIMMPVKDGYEATKEIRNSGLLDCEDIPIISLTADALGATEERCLKIGMNGHLNKPINTNNLYTVLAQEFERRK